MATPMKQGPPLLPPGAAKALATFTAVLAVCLAVVVYLGLSAPAARGMADYLAHGVFSTLCALPTGAAWHSFSKALKGPA